MTVHQRHVYLLAQLSVSHYRGSVSLVEFVKFVEAHFVQVANPSRNNNKTRFKLRPFIEKAYRVKLTFERSLHNILEKLQA